MLEKIFYYLWCFVLIFGVAFLFVDFFSVDNLNTEEKYIQYKKMSEYCDQFNMKAYSNMFGDLFCVVKDY